MNKKRYQSIKDKVKQKFIWKMILETKILVKHF